jgi:hypothetical protein
MNDLTPMPLDRRKKHGLPDERIERFVVEYVACRNGAEAARRAGYSHKAAKEQAADLLTRPNVQEAVVSLAWRSAKHLDVDGKMILGELAAIAFSPIIPGYVRASDKKAALELLGTHLKLWEGSKGDRIININILALDEKTL